MPSIPIPSQTEIVEILRQHPLIRLKEMVLRAFVVGSVAKGTENSESDIDILFEIVPRGDESSDAIEDRYRQKLRQYFVTHDIKGKMDSVHPQWAGRRVDVYFTYDANLETRPKILLPGPVVRAEPSVRHRAR